jgi:UDP-N-acetyl-2-amino-2-deoxyglucuronate dehydrogenase
VKQLNIGVIGLGEIGAVHCDALLQIPQAKLLAVADINEARAKQIAAQTGAQPYQDYQELLAREDIDAVIIATPDHLHKEPCIHAAKAGKHILVEKPLAMTFCNFKQSFGCSRRFMPSFFPVLQSTHGHTQKFGKF